MKAEQLKNWFTAWEEQSSPQTLSLLYAYLSTLVSTYQADTRNQHPYIPTRAISSILEEVNIHAKLTAPEDSLIPVLENVSDKENQPWAGVDIYTIGNLWFQVRTAQNINSIFHCP